MNKFAKATVLSLSLIFGAANAAVELPYYESQASCDTAAKAKTAAGYVPSKRHKDYADTTRIAGLEEKSLETKACALMDTAGGKHWVFLKQGTLAYFKNGVAAFLSWCRNTIYEIHYIAEESQVVPLAASSQNVAKIKVTEVIEKDIVLVENFFCKKPDGTTVPAVIQNGQPSCPEVTLTAPVRVDEPIRVQPHVIQGQLPAPATKTVNAGCPVSGCVGGQKETFTGSKREPRTDGKCVMPTNIGYRIQIGKDGGSRKLVAQLIDKNDKPIGGKVVYVGGDVSGSCNTDEDTTAANWEKVRGDLGLPSICKPS